MARLYLLHVHKLHILESPPIQPLDRKSVGLKCNDPLEGVITLPSGRTIRKLDHGNLRRFKIVILLFLMLLCSVLILLRTTVIDDALSRFLLFNCFPFTFTAPPMNRRTWNAPPRADKLTGIPGRTLSDRHIVAEV